MRPPTRFGCSQSLCIICDIIKIESTLARELNFVDRLNCCFVAEPTIAAAIAASGIPRNQLWITSKINVEMTVDNMTQVLYDKVLTPLNTP